LSTTGPHPVGLSLLESGEGRGGLWNLSTEVADDLDYLAFVFAVQVVGAALLVANRFVPLALILLGPILVNILLFHSLMAPEGLPMALFAIALLAILVIRAWFVA
jgi:hypothetical protein